MGRGAKAPLPCGILVVAILRSTLNLNEINLILQYQVNCRIRYLMVSSKSAENYISLFGSIFTM